MAANEKLNNELRMRLLDLKAKLEDVFTDYHVKKDVNMVLDDISHLQSTITQDYRNYVWLELHKDKEIEQIKTEAKEKGMPSSMIRKIDDIGKKEASSFTDIAQQIKDVNEIKQQLGARSDVSQVKVSSHSMFKRPQQKEEVVPDNKPKLK